MTTPEAKAWSGRRARRRRTAAFSLGSYPPIVLTSEGHSSYDFTTPFPPNLAPGSAKGPTGIRTARRRRPRSTRPSCARSRRRATSPASARSSAASSRWRSSCILSPLPRPHRPGLLLRLPQDKKPDARRQSASAQSGLIIQRLTAEPSRLSRQCHPSTLICLPAHEGSQGSAALVNFPISAAQGVAHTGTLSQGNAR